MEVLRIMKRILATVTISLALPGLDLSTTTFAQASGGAAGGAAGGSAGATRGASTASGTIAGPTGRVAPGGVTAGQTAIQPGASLTTQPSIINPGGISATPPQTVGRTFERTTTIGGTPADTIIDPVAPQPTFPSASTLPQPILPNSGVGTISANGSVAGNPVSVGNAPVTVGNTPVRVGNIVGANVGTAAVRVPPETVAINLPPGARITTNAFGAAVVGTPPVGAVTPTIVPTNSVGRGPVFDSSTARSSGATREPIRPNAVPRNAPIVPNR